MTTPRATWEREIRRLAWEREAPFDGRQAHRLLALAWTLATRARATTGTGILLQAIRVEHGERAVRRLVPYFVDHQLLEMTVKPARKRDGIPGRAAEYALTLPAKPCPPASVEVGSDRADQSGQRCAQEPAPQPLSDPSPLSTTLPTREHETVVPLVTRAYTPATRRGGAR